MTRTESDPSGHQVIIRITPTRDYCIPGKHSCKRQADPLALPERDEPGEGNTFPGQVDMRPVGTRETAESTVGRIEEVSGRMRHPQEMISALAGSSQPREEHLGEGACRQRLPAGKPLLVP